MTPAEFMVRFERFGEAPNAIEKMREMILALAVQGKLVHRQGHEGNGKTLLEGLLKLPLEQNSKSRASAEITTVPEVGLDIPEHWALTTVENTTRETGYFCDGDWVESKDQDPEGDVRLIQLADVGDGQYRNRSSRFMNRAAAKRLNCSYLKAGDILIARMPDPLGRCCRFPGDNKPAVTVVDVCILRPNEEFFDPQFLVVAINSPVFRLLVAQQATGTTRTRISRGNLSVLPIPLPPLAEQKRIVAKVDELMALCDRLEAQQQERETRHAALARASLARFAAAPTPANLDFLFHHSYTISPPDLRKAILQLAFLGKLLPQDPNDESALILLGKARTEKARLIENGLVKKEPWSENLQEATNLYELPRGWEWTHVSDVVEKVTVGFVGSMKEQYCDDGIPFLRCQNVRVNRYEPIGLTFINEKFHRAIKKSTLRPGDVVVTRSGNVGVTCVIPDSLPEANCSDLVIIKRPLAIIPEFLSYFINSIAAGQIEAKTVGIALTHFNTQSVAQLTVALPPLPEQRRIVAKVDQVMALVDQLETQLAESRATATRLMDAIVAELTGRTTAARALAASASTNGAAAPVAPGNAGQWPASDPSGPLARGPKGDNRRVAESPAAKHAYQPRPDKARDQLATLLRERGSLSNSEAQTATGLDPAIIRSHLQALVASGHARTEGQRRGMRYHSM